MPKKKIKSEKRDLGNLSHAELKKIVGAANLGTYKVDELKGFLNSKGLSATGKKQDLMDRVEQWVEEN